MFLEKFWRVFPWDFLWYLYFFFQILGWWKLGYFQIGIKITIDRSCFEFMKWFFEKGGKVVVYLCIFMSKNSVFYLRSIILWLMLILHIHRWFLQTSIQTVVALLEVFIYVLWFKIKKHVPAIIESKLLLICQFISVILIGPKCSKNWFSAGLHVSCIFRSSDEFTLGFFLVFYIFFSKICLDRSSNISKFA